MPDYIIFLFKQKEKVIKNPEAAPDFHPLPGQINIVIEQLRIIVDNYSSREIKTKISFILQRRGCVDDG